jgi:hypothetical protein
MDMKSSEGIPFDEVDNYLGRHVTLNGNGDLAMSYKQEIRDQQVYEILKRTKSGLVLCQKVGTKETDTFRSANLDLVECQTNG